MRALVGFVCLVSLQVLAQSPNPMVGLDLDTNAIRIGEQATLTISVAFPSGTNSVVWPVIDKQINEHLEVVKVGPIDTTNGGALDKMVRTVTITSFDTGTWVIPPLQFTINGTPLSTTPRALQVRTVQLDEPQALRPIKGIPPLPFSFSHWLRRNWIAVLIGLICLVAFFLILRYIRSRKALPKANVVSAPELSLKERILHALSLLEKERLWQQGDHKAYHSRLTDLLRTYIEERYRVPALESTTDELLRELRVSPLSADHRNQLENMLRLADMVKFAKTLPSPEENDQMMVGTVRFIQETASTSTPIHVQE